MGDEMFDTVKNNTQTVLQFQNKLQRAYHPELTLEPLEFAGLYVNFSDLLLERTKFPEKDAKFKLRHDKRELFENEISIYSDLLIESSFTLNL